MTNVSQVERSLKHMLEGRADVLARETGCIERQRKFSGADLLQTLVFGWLSHPDASLEALASIAAIREVKVTDTAVHKRFNESCAQFLHAILQEMTSVVIEAGLDLSSVRAIVTGASSGIGLETARALASAGAEVILAVRNTDAGAKAAEDIAKSTSNERVRVVALDLANQASVANFVQSWNGPLHLLINNAGVIPSTLSRTAEGWELQFATNYLGHFALSLGLHDALAVGARDRGEARIISLNSTAHMRSPIVFDDIHFERREYDPQAAYAQSKTADSLFAVEATRRWAADGMVANAVNPGGVATGLQRDFTQKQKDYLADAEVAGVFVYKTVEQGAATTLAAAVAPEFAHTGGHYLTDGREAHTVPNAADLFENGDGVKQWAIDPDTAQKLWTVSLEFIGQPATQNTDAS